MTSVTETPHEKITIQVHGFNKLESAEYFADNFASEISRRAPDDIKLTVIHDARESYTKEGQYDAIVKLATGLDFETIADAWKHAVEESEIMMLDLDLVNLPIAIFGGAEPEFVESPPLPDGYPGPRR